MEQIFVPKARHSELIGRGGERLKQISSETGARVKIPPRDDTSSTIDITGTPAQIAAAKKAISDIVGFAVSNEPFVKDQLAVNPSKFGALIGRGGATLAQLVKDTGVAAIDVPRKESASQLVTVEGSAVSLEKALVAIRALVGDASLKYVGGAASSSSSSSSSPAPPAPAAAPPAPAAAPSASSSTTTAALTKDQIAAFGNRKPGEKFTHAVLVPKANHGSLVGAGGAKIQQLEQQSGARIQLPNKNDPDATIRVTGTVAQVDAALDAMTKVLGFAPQPVPVTKIGAAAAAATATTTATAATGSAPSGGAVDMSRCTKLYIPKSALGQVIGRGGANAAAIEAACGVKLVFPTVKSTDPAVQVFGSASAFDKARAAIDEALGYQPSLEPLVVHFIDVDPADHAKLIGEGGKTLKKLEDESDCDITVPPKGSKDRRVSIEGGPKDVQVALKLIATLLGMPSAKSTVADEAAANAFLAAASNAIAKEHIQVAPPTAEELADITKASQKLWSLDTGRLKISDDVVVNLQQSTNVYNTADVARELFFKSVDSDVFLAPTFRAFYSLLDNYSAATVHAEQVSQHEIDENWAFLHSVCATPCMRYAHQWCAAKGYVPSDEAAWQKLLYTAWFALYSRDGVRDASSGFEHVFVGELKEEAVSGLHNWLQFHRVEKSGAIDYKGYIRPRGQTSANGHVFSLKFSWHGKEKPVSTFVLGSTPEYEMALYSMCFFNRQEKTQVIMDGVPVTVTCFRISSKYGDKIGSAFPESK